MPTNDELARRIDRLEHERIDRLEHEVEHLRSDQALNRALTAMTDRDLADIHAKLDAHTRSLNALHQTQVEQGQRLDRVEGRLDQINGSLGGLTTGMHTMETLLRRLTDAPDGD